MSTKENKLIKISLKILNTEHQERVKKLHDLKKSGFNFPNDFKKNTDSNKIYLKYNKLTNQKIVELNVLVNIAGRIIKRRTMGKSAFIVLQDISGEIQLYVTKKCFNNQFYITHFKKLDLGDIISAKGKLFKTRTGELSIYCVQIRLLTKSLRPLPDKYHGLSNKEICYRQRYLDLISNKKSKNIFIIRSKIISVLRNFLTKKNFLEVETPMMHSIPGGANAQPFVTYHNTLDTQLYLRIAPELYLKQLIIGGFERIFEINRCFRNEGISIRHNPEFTMIEIYMAYSNYETMMLLTENLFKTVTKKIFGNTKIKYKEHFFEFNNRFKRFTMKEAILNFNPLIQKTDLNNFDKVTKICSNLNIEIKKYWTLGRLQTEIFEKTVEKKLIYPTFITEYPVDVSPLARRNDNNSNLTDRFELFIAGVEIGNGFSELNDSEDQKKRFKIQNEEKKIEKHKEFFSNQEYITALEYGLPPTSGLGIGVDRFVMLLTNSESIRDVIFFPTLRPI